MIIIRNYGLESEAVRDISASYTIPVAKLFKVKEDEVVFLTERGYLIQNGEDQTDYFSYVEVLYPSNIKIDKEAVNDVLKEIYSKFTFHTIIRFIPFKEEDLRYYKVKKKPKRESNAVMIFIMDVSGSMDDS